ncbi:MAG: hypothetical protein OJF47_001908 [Nitrospira sp.]|nr:MAG: hypothetical protein OJF47_001908 [Nitrospira sp.]
MRAYGPRSDLSILTPYVSTEAGKKLYEQEMERIRPSPADQACEEDQPG